MGLLMMLLTMGGLFIAAILLIVAFWKKFDWLRNFVLSAVAVWFVFYIAMLLGFSLLSEEKTLGFNEPKEFCGFYLDCHMHTSISNVRKTKTIGDRTAKGEFYIVRVKVFSNAKRAELGLHSPEFYVIDGDSNRYPRVGEVENPSPPFDQKVPAGGGFENEVVFDLPVDVKNLRLDAAEGIGVDKIVESFLIGDEDSLFHGRVRFNLEQQPIRADL